MRPGFAAILILALVVGLQASPAKEPQLSITIVESSLARVLEFYQILRGRPVLVSDKLGRRPVSLNTKQEIPRSEAIKFIESRLGNYDIHILEQGGKLVALGPVEKDDTSTAPAVAAMPKDKSRTSDQLYAETDGLRGAELKAKLQDITSEHHKSIGYGPTKDALMAIDEDPANTNNIITFYERKSVPKANFGKGDSSVAWEREHVLRQSYGAEDGRFAKSDLHNLFPSLKEANSPRSSLYFDESDDDQEVPDKAPPVSHDADLWEPPDEIRGDIARIVFYMDTRYDGSNSKQDINVAEVASSEEAIFGNVRTLLAWHRADPVSAKERERNEEIYRLQGNRNPFVDHPEFAEKIFNTWQAMTRFRTNSPNIDTPPPAKDALYKMAPLK